MKRIYLASSFSTRVDGDGNVHPHYRQHMERIIEAMESAGYEIFCAIKYEGWKISTSRTPSESVAKDLDQIDKSDIVLAVLHEDASRGVQYEMGYAAGLGKDVVAATEPGDKIAYFNEGLIKGGKIKHIVYSGADELISGLKKLYGQ